MRSSEPYVVMNSRYSIDETSRLLGIHRHTLRKYTNRGLIKCGFRRVNGRKFYLGSEILRFWRATK
ncbi:MAG: helix-turn-helix domain-containing protein [Bacteroidales bacterium]|jgi:DNA-binding transcriptional MerR regulator|nr:helix-turn-helix domain-containing protein [Muribaculaceae bacterium]MBR7022796.1 helix-turn-helix domain-containing protein [Bacteroidales bacterium]